jgi:hypothetical protein
LLEVRGTCAAGGSFIHDGFRGRSEGFEQALDCGVDFVAGDGGSTDCGAAHLGADDAMIPTESLRQYMAYILRNCVSRKIPFLIGSANLAGTRAGVARFRSIVEQVAADEGLSFRAAYIDSEINKDYLLGKIQTGKVRNILSSGACLTAADVAQSSHIVAMMGTEQYIEALKGGAQVIVGGRTSDPALWAAVPIWKGIPPAIAWHMGKTLDHGAYNLELGPGKEGILHASSSWVVGVCREDHFLVQASNSVGRVPAVRVARSTLHENTSATTFYEPGGIVDISDCRFEQVDKQTVKVTGSRFQSLPYTMKLEGARPVGFRAITMCAFRAESGTRNLEAECAATTQRILDRAVFQGVDPSRYRLIFRVYGKNGVLRDWERGDPAFQPRELFVLAECVAETREIAHVVMAMTETQLHFLGGVDHGGAFPLSPQVIDTGEVYEFNIWHLLSPDDPLECVKIEYRDY